MPLSERLRERRELIARYVPPQTQEAARRVIEEIQASGIHQRVLRPGMESPSFELPDQNHLPISSAGLLKLGRLVVIFFRGRWCPFCIAQLEAMSEVAASIRGLGAELVAISPQTVHQSSLMRDQHRLDFAVLSDSGNRVARGFGLVYSVPEYQRSIYQQSFTNLSFLNGDSSWELPIPATFILERDGCVLWASAGADYTCRPDPAEILQALQS
jgi:peroxiredoxin